jgi:hypothetical protein
MAIGLPVTLVAADVFQELVADSAAETFGMPAELHGIHDAAGDGAIATATCEAASLTGGGWAAR